MKFRKLKSAAAAVAAAVVIAAECFSVCAADIKFNYSQYGYEYYYYYDGVYYSDIDSVKYVAQGSEWTSVYKTKVIGYLRWYSLDTYKLYETEAEASMQGTHYCLAIVKTGDADKKIPDAPKNVKARSGVESITVIWDAVEDAEEYYVNISVSGRNTYLASTLVTTKETKCTFAGLVGGQQYDITVCAKGGKTAEIKGILAQKAKTTTSTDSTTVPKPYEDDAEEIAISTLEAPTGFKATRKTDSIVLRWGEVEGADAYRVYMYDSSKKKYVLYKNIKGEKCTIKDLLSGTKYKFKVAALEYIDGKYVMGEVSKAVAVTTK
ncbi:MAG: fibronectin type III domain-containing protein [Huintestinicola sp.]